ncbi:MAG: threonine synthase [Treponema sp.]|jgi:threonine synthase|nr:threonine synthase [Treponema sp.]
MRNVRAAVCVACGAEHEAGNDTYTCKKCGGVLEIVYDYDYIKSRVNAEKIAARGEFSIWRYLEFLPVEEDSKLGPLRVGWSPLYRTEKLGEALGIPNLYVKDDGINPTSSLKDRASAIAVVRAARAGRDTVACSSTGNAASSLAGGAAAMGLKSFIFVPGRAPQGKLTQLLIFGAVVISVRGNYEDTFKLSAEAIEKYGWYNRNAAINPYLSEGKKTVSFEIAEQLGGLLRAGGGGRGAAVSAGGFAAPDYVAISVGDGCTIAGLWKGFKDLYATGFIDRLPRLVSVQASGCCPVNRAVETGRPIERMEENTLADSIAVGVPRNGAKALAAIRESGGITVNVSDDEILAAMRLLGKNAGVFGEPAGVTGTAGLKKAAEQNLIPAGAVVVSVVTGNGLKDVASAQRAAGIEPSGAEGAADSAGAGAAGSPALLRIAPEMKLLEEEFARRGLRTQTP